MLQDLDDAIKKLLINEVPIDPREVEISFDMPKRDWAASMTKPTVNLYLYDLRQNLVLREEMNAWLRDLDKKEGRGLKRRMPARIDASYFITAWARAPEDEHRILWRVMETLFRFKELPEAYQQGTLANQIVTTRMRTGQADGILRNAAEFWSSMDNHLKPSINFQVTLPMFDYAVEGLKPLRLVKERRFRVIHLKQNVIERSTHPLSVSGVVVSRQNVGLEGCLVALEPRRQAEDRPSAHPLEQNIGLLERFPKRAFTDQAGFFYFIGIPGGKYRLQVSCEGYKPLTREIEIKTTGEESLTLTLEILKKKLKERR